MTRMHNGLKQKQTVWNLMAERWKWNQLERNDGNEILDGLTRLWWSLGNLVCLDPSFHHSQAIPGKRGVTLVSLQRRSANKKLSLKSDLWLHVCIFSLSLKMTEYAPRWVRFYLGESICRDWAPRTLTLKKGHWHDS